jgi:NAD(P)-dependent dehydrogenase (short-subunit alcohol dehydrogenase family)
MLLEGKVAVITGAGSGVGRAAALRFVREGARLALGDLRGDWGEQTLQQVRAAGGDALFRAGDVRREADVADLIAAAVAAYGRLDIVFNNVGVASTAGKAFEDYDDADWDRILDTNLRGVFYGCKHAVRQFKQQGGGGAIVNTASAAGLVAWGGVVYGASKGGVVQLTRALAIEVAPRNIRVNCVCPGGMPTNFGRDTGVISGERAERLVDDLRRMHPLGRPIDPEDVADAVLYLASDLAGNVTGVALPVDGGYVAR